MRHSLHDAWWRLATQQHPQSISDTLACGVLQAGSWLYGAAAALRNTAFDRRWAGQAALPCPVVSIGNLTVGGTGKTACAILVARKLARLGKQVAVLSRGYGGARDRYTLQSGAGGLLIDGQPGEAAAGLADEPQLLAQALDGVPVLVDARRDRSGRAACEQFGAQAVVLDDGFQHRQLRRDCDIVLLQAGMPPSGWPILPRGPMREPMSALRRADIVIITKADERLDTVAVLREQVRRVKRELVVATAAHAPTTVRDPRNGTSEPASALAGRRVALVSSIGDPAGFEATVRRLEAQVAWHQAFPDHHRFTPADWAQVQHAPQPGLILTTEKDWVRLRAVVPPGAPVKVLGVDMQILSGEDALDARLARL